MKKNVQSLTIWASNELLSEQNKQPNMSQSFFGMFNYFTDNLYQWMHEVLGEQPGRLTDGVSDFIMKASDLMTQIQDARIMPSWDMGGVHGMACICIFMSVVFAGHFLLVSRLAEPTEPRTKFPLFFAPQETGRSKALRDPLPRPIQTDENVRRRLTPESWNNRRPVVEMEL